MTRSRQGSSSQSDFIEIRGLRYHLRRWGRSDAPLLFIAHGWMDLSATFERVAQALTPQLQVMIPDWRGFGFSGWDPNGYWFQDYVADLDALISHYAPQAPVLLAGHSMGAQICAIYSGLRPKRVSRLALLDGLFLPDGNPATIARRYRIWLNSFSGEPTSTPSYESFEALAARVQKRHPKLSADTSEFIARCWGRSGDDGLVHLQSDPRHLLDMPRTYSQAESDAIWQCVTAPTLFVDGGASPFPKQLGEDEVQRRRSQFQQVEQTVIEDAGHMLHFEAPDRLADILLRFFSRP